MNETEIVAQLKQNIPTRPETFGKPAPESADTSVGQASAVQDSFGLDDMTQYKLHDYFGEQFKPANDESKKQAQFIYEQVSKMVPEKDYGSIIAKIREIERLVGNTHSERRMYRLYQWLKLDAVRRQTEAEMGALSYAS